jgi:hypothetical protein
MRVLLLAALAAVAPAVPAFAAEAVPLDVTRTSSDRGMVEVCSGDPAVEQRCSRVVISTAVGSSGVRQTSLTYFSDVRQPGRLVHQVVGFGPVPDSAFNVNANMSHGGSAMLSIDTRGLPGFLHVVCDITVGCTVDPNGGGIVIAEFTANGEVNASTSSDTTRIDAGVESRLKSDELSGTADVVGSIHGDAFDTSSSRRLATLTHFRQKAKD